MAGPRLFLLAAMALRTLGSGVADPSLSIVDDPHAEPAAKNDNEQERQPYERAPTGYEHRIPLRVDDGPDQPRWWALPEVPLAGRREGGALSRRLAQDLAARDKRFGVDLSAGSTIARALRQSVREHTATFGEATMSGEIDGSGQLLSLRLDKHQGGGSGDWRRAARAAKKTLQGRRFTLPSRFVNGALVSFSVRSWEQLPSGSGRPEGDKPTRFERPRWPYYAENKRSSPKEELATTITDANGRWQHDPTGPPLLVCRMLTVGAGGFDASDLGAHPQRLVSVRFTTQPVEAPVVPRDCAACADH